TFFGASVKHIGVEGNNKVLTTPYGKFRAPVIVFASGAFSLLFAQELGFAKNFAVLPVAGNFYDGGQKLNGKVYTVQGAIPFAAPHGDPDVLDSKKTRFGPTTKPLPLLERHRYWTIRDFFRYPILTLRGIWTLIKLLSRRELAGYILKNLLFEVP